mmetsp:Transcript_4466/g.5527  ORF Transcript_4466/g.5527 Transcript_4466/m.5527 type:complete len:636 (-) Transcript_4466:845-2752(-)|eukprot:CAMPEP_0184013688 /NCGR_PEP_ID=MMETSP0954-20121128/5165_1 /TAXON_ID=627963 /ORGANISM="Aplanochytrium sp, Strain PBS07" /LENGTH=635 /DNA_ID=CAMNT_0026293931 /DNA_START=163 /DNA_END=2070 /DNA_ORIENTATION=-
MRLIFRLAALAAVFQTASSYFHYLPGVAPKQFADGQDVQMSVNKINSVKTQLPYKYYSLPVCKPAHIVDVAENLGEVLAGDKIENSLYELKMKQDEYCKVLCRKQYDKKDVKQFQKMIHDDYRVHWIIDNLPSAIRIFDERDPSIEHFESGFPLGIIVFMKGKDDLYYLYNHIRFTIRYHENPVLFDGARVVGFLVEPFTVQHQSDGEYNEENPKLKTCNEQKQVQHTDGAQPINEPGEVIWTYDVTWEPSDVPWASRWDVFLRSSEDDQIHWFSIINSLMIVMFLTGMVAMIMMRALNKDIARYNNEESAEDAQEETGWKLVHGDVFRPPAMPMLFAVFCGSGVQIAAMTSTLMVFALLGFLSPAHRGGLMTAMLLLFVFMGYPAGYVSSRLYKMFGEKNWKHNTLVTAMLFPGIVFSCFFVVNIFVWYQGSSGAVPFGTMFALLVLWFGISFPLSSIGAYSGFKKETISNPTRFNHIPRQIPPQPFYMNALVSVLVGGILPFGAVFIEVFFIMSSIWLHQIYYVFGFLMLVILILIATCAEITIVMCYFQLCSEDHRWWWRSFLTSGSSAIYLFLYSIMYFVTKLDMTKFTAGLIYFVYMFLCSFSFFLLTGMIGFFACFWFVRKIYAAIKID